MADVSKHDWGSFPARMLKTGQTTQYSSELDDGHYEAGIAKPTTAYEVLTTGQYSGACVFLLNGKTETQSHNCVLDRNTGLMWARYTSAQSASVGPGSDGLMAWTGAADDIFAYCAAANVAELGGYDDWRIPNDLELKNLCNMEAPNALPDSTAFPGWSTANYYWSSTTLLTNTNHAIFVSFFTGNVITNTKATAYFASLVRG